MYDSPQPYQQQTQLESPSLQNRASMHPPIINGLGKKTLIKSVVMTHIYI